MFLDCTARLALSIAMLTIVPQSPLVCDRVDLIELNRVYDDQGRSVLTQMIFWDWTPADGQFHVVAWRMWNQPEQQPTRDWAQGEYVLLWHDGELLREVRAPAWSESWTQYDREMADRQRWPKVQRRGLSLASPLAGRKPSLRESPEP